MEQDNTIYSSKIGVEIWGHRFTNSQRGPEYTLEFLNVFAGTGFSLQKKHYEKRKMIEFRQFVYEGEKEGINGDIAIFEDEKKLIIQDKLGIDEKQLEDLQNFFKNLTIPLINPAGKSANRSWYAQMMYPLHESLLFSEIRVKRNKKKNNLSVDYERNFFARGGELYYLMLYYGTLNNEELRTNIEKNTKKLLSSTNGVISVINKINDSFEKKDSEQFSPLIKDKELAEVIKGWEKSEYPTLPKNDLKIYKIFAEELNALLMLKLDIYEMFDILTSLITFQLHRYMIFQAEQISNEKSYYFIDCLDGQNKSVKFLAQDSYRRHEMTVKDAYEIFVQNRVEEVFSEDKAEYKINYWRKSFNNKNGYQVLFKELNFNKLHDPKKKQLIEALETENIEDAKKMLKYLFIKFYMEDLSKNQIPILKTLARDGQFIVSGKGLKARYVLHDNILSALVYITLNGQNNLPFDDFLNELYQKYRIIIGEDAAKNSGLYSREGVNLAHFRSNERKMRQKLKQNGLLQEYSDATALIINPYFT